MRAFVVSIVALSGCGGADDLADLETFMAGVRASQEVRIEPLPAFEEATVFTYRPREGRSPFAPAPRHGELSGRTGADALAPDFNRPRQRLERYPISRLSLVGSLSRSGARYGLVRDAEGLVHRLEVGDYLGEDHGRIRKLGPSTIELVEIVADGAGGWVERVRVIAPEALPGNLEAGAKE